MAIEVNNRDDFKIKLTIKDQDGVVIPYTEIDWEAHYYTVPNIVMKVGCKNGIMSPNCEIIDETVNIYVDNFNWGRSGVLKRKVYVPGSCCDNHSDRLDRDCVFLLSEFRQA